MRNNEAPVNGRSKHSTNNITTAAQRLRYEPPWAKAVFVALWVPLALAIGAVLYGC